MCYGNFHYSSFFQSFSPGAKCVGNQGKFAVLFSNFYMIISFPDTVLTYILHFRQRCSVIYFCISYFFGVMWVSDFADKREKKKKIQVLDMQ